MSFALFGCAPDTGNLGVSALCYGVIFGLQSAGCHERVDVVDYGKGPRAGAVPTPSGQIDFARFAAYPTRRWYRQACLEQIDLLLRLGIPLTPASRRLGGASAILDISGGDSFTDLYGPGRFRSVTMPKQIAIRNGIPLVLLPQTYGPFNDRATRERASTLVKGASSAWARDARSYEILKDLLGNDFDPARHRLGVDVAFLLPRVSPHTERPAGPVVGINVSGLIHNRPEESVSRYSFRADYRQAIAKIVRFFCEQQIHVILLPHVLAHKGVAESDREACEAVLAGISPAHRTLVHVAEDPAGPCEAKGLIASLDWFMGTRMHATIAGLSSGVPTAAISYSDKTLGVFESCGQGAHVHDPRKLSTEEIVERVLWSYNNREKARESLSLNLPAVLGQARGQMDTIVAVLKQDALSRSARRSKLR